MKKTPSIGLALGAGGARGLAHIPVLELLDDMDLTPCCIAGSSIGAVVGALYAAGHSGADIRTQVTKLVGSKPRSWSERLRDRTRLSWLDVFLPELGKGGLIATDRIAAHLRDVLGCGSFAKLQIPLIVVATDYRSGRPVLLRSGNLMTALQATMAIPGVFSPVPYRRRLLMDGGMVDPVPYEVLRDRCDLIIAVDVIGAPGPGKDEPPSLPDALRGSVRIMQKTILSEKIRRGPPDILISMDVHDIGIMQFGRAEEILSRARRRVRRLRHELRSRLS